MLNARELKVFYGVIQGLKGVDIDVYDREIVTLIGSNGAGKTSTLNGIVNLVRSSGRVSFLTTISHAARPTRSCVAGWRWCRRDGASLPT